METSFPELTQDERTYASLAHALQMPGFFIAPLVILIVQNKSRFVRFHATNALILQAVKVLGMVVFMFVWIALMFGTLAIADNAKSEPPFIIFLIFPFIWLFFMAMFALELTLSVLFALKAGRGEWKGYPIIGRLAQRFSLPEPQPVPPVASA